jgi:hypothetical protein
MPSPHSCGFELDASSPAVLGLGVKSRQKRVTPLLKEYTVSRLLMLALGTIFVIYHCTLLLLRALTDLCRVCDGD